jgi:hypothetical protein
VHGDIGLDFRELFFDFGGVGPGASVVEEGFLCFGCAAFFEEPAGTVVFSILIGGGRGRLLTFRGRMGDHT